MEKIHKINLKDKEMLYKYFKSGEEIENLVKNDFFEIKEYPYFSVNLKGRGEEDYLKAFIQFRDGFISLEKKLLMDPEFWQTLNLTKFRDEIIKENPEVLTSEKEFKKIVLQSLNVEGYIYRVLMGAFFVNKEVPLSDHEKYFRLIPRIGEVYLFILKDRIFNNGNFLIKILDILEDEDLCAIMKKTYYRNGKADRIGRRVLRELKWIYPSVFIHALEKDELKEYMEKIIANIQVEKDFSWIK